MSKSQERLEECSKAVTGACRSLVRQVQKIIEGKRKEGEEDVDYGTLSGHDFKVRQMEQQVRSHEIGLIGKVRANEVWCRLRSCSWRTRSVRRGIGWERCGRSLIRTRIDCDSQSRRRSYVQQRIHQH